MNNSEDKTQEEQLKEAIRKNLLQCAIITLVCGIGVLLLGKITVAIICFAISVVFAVVTLVLYLKDKKESTKESSEESDKENDKENDKEE